MLCEFCCVAVCSQEASKHTQDSPAESQVPGRRNVLPRISDVDMFSSTEVAECERVSGNPTVNCTDHSSDEIELLSPNPLPHLSYIQNSVGLMGSSAAVDRESGRQKQNVVGSGSGSDVESLNDVEPDGPESLSSSVLCSEETSRKRRAIVTLVDSSPVILSSYSRLSGDKHDQLITERQQQSTLSAGSLSSRLLGTGTSLPDSRGVTATSAALSADLMQQSEQSIADDDSSQVICELMTQTSTADQSFQSCVTMEYDVSQVNTQLLIYFYDS